MSAITNLIPSENNANVTSSVIDDIYFEIKLECLDFINQAYSDYKSDTSKIFKVDEIQITAGLYGKLDGLPSAKSLGYKFIYDNKQLSLEMTIGKETPKKAKLADITIFKHHLDTRQSFEFDIEAKLLGEQQVGSYSATDLIREYVMDAGMGKFLKSIYQNDGFMIGYVINGLTSKIIDKINEKINSVYTLNEIIIPKGSEYVSHYSSSKILHHIFLVF